MARTSKEAQKNLLLKIFEEFDDYHRDEMLNTAMANFKRWTEKNNRAEVIELNTWGDQPKRKPPKCAPVDVTKKRLRRTPR